MKSEDRLLFVLKDNQEISLPKMAEAIGLSVVCARMVRGGGFMSRRRRMTSKSLLFSPVILYAAISSVNRGTAFG